MNHIFKSETFPPAISPCFPTQHDPFFGNINTAFHNGLKSILKERFYFFHKSLSMSLSNNFNHQIYRSDLPVILWLEFCCRSNLPVLFMVWNFKCIFFVLWFFLTLIALENFITKKIFTYQIYQYILFMVRNFNCTFFVVWFSLTWKSIRIVC